jgi:hypothetical protein
MLVAIAGVSVLLAGAIKWRRYRDLREQIVRYQRDETALLDAFQQYAHVPLPCCGNVLRARDAYLAAAQIMKRKREQCEREMGRIW